MRVRFRTNEQLRTRPRSSARVSSPSRSDPSRSISASSMLDLRPMGAASSRLRLACGGCGRSWPRGGNTPRTVGHDAHQTRGRHAGLDSQVPPTASPRSNRLPIYPSLPPRGGAVLIPAWCLSQPLLGQGDGADDAGPPGSIHGRHFIFSTGHSHTAALPTQPARAVSRFLCPAASAYGGRSSRSS